MGAITPSELFEADVIAVPEGMETPKNKKWTLRGYLQKIVSNQETIKKQNAEILSLLKK